MSVSSYSTTASSNTTISGTNIAENCPAGNLNNAIRQMMADIRTELTDAVLTLTAKATVAEIRTALDALEATAALEVIGALTPAADRVPYYTGASSASLATLTSFARTLLDDADAATARATLGGMGVTASSIANPGYVKISVPSGGTLILQWGTTTALANTGSQSVTYPTAFSSFSIPVVTGGLNQTNYDQNFPAAYASSTTGFNFVNAADSSMPLFWVAVGV